MKKIERTNCIYYERTIAESGDEEVTGFRCLAGIPTSSGCPPDCDEYIPKKV